MTAAESGPGAADGDADGAAPTTKRDAGGKKLPVAKQAADPSVIAKSGPATGPATSSSSASKRVLPATASASSSSLAASSVSAGLRWQAAMTMAPGERSRSRSRGRGAGTRLVSVDEDWDCAGAHGVGSDNDCLGDGVAASAEETAAQREQAAQARRTKYRDGVSGFTHRKFNQFPVSDREKIREQASGYATATDFLRGTVPHYNDLSKKETERLRKVVCRAEDAPPAAPEILKRKRRPGGGRKLICPDIGEDLYGFYIDLTDRHVKVSRKMLQLRAIALVQRVREKNPGEKVPTISLSWLQRWCDRFKVVSRVPNKKIPTDPEVAYKRDLACWKQWWSLAYYYARRGGGMELVSIDEKPMYMSSLEGKKILSDKGSRAVTHLSNVGQFRSRFTVMTAVSTPGIHWPGGKPPLEIVFRGAGSKRIRRSIKQFFEQRPTPYVVRVVFARSASYNADRFSDYLRTTLIPAMRGERVEHVADPDADDDSGHDESSSDDEGEKNQELFGEVGTKRQRGAGSSSAISSSTLGGGSSSSSASSSSGSRSTRGSSSKTAVISADFFTGHRPEAALEAGVPFGWVAAARTDVFSPNDTHLHYPLSRLYQQKEVELQAARATTRSDYMRVVVSRVDALRLLLESWEEVEHARYGAGFACNGFFPDVASSEVGSGLRRMFEEESDVRSQAKKLADDLFAASPGASAEKVYKALVAPRREEMCPGSHSGAAAAKKEQAIEDSGAANTSFRNSDELGVEGNAESESEDELFPAGGVSFSTKNKKETSTSVANDDGEGGDGDEDAWHAMAEGLSHAEILEKIEALARQAGDRYIARQVAVRKQRVCSSHFKKQGEMDHRPTYLQEVAAQHALIEAEVKQSFVKAGLDLRTQNTIANLAEKIIAKTTHQNEAQKTQALRFNSVVLQDPGQFHAAVETLVQGKFPREVADEARLNIYRRHQSLLKQPATQCGVLGRTLQEDEKGAGREGRYVYAARVFNVIGAKEAARRRAIFEKLAAGPQAQPKVAARS